MQKRIVRKDEQMKLIMNAGKAGFPIISGAWQTAFIPELFITGSVN